MSFALAVNTARLYYDKGGPSRRAQAAINKLGVVRAWMDQHLPQRKRVRFVIESDDEEEVVMVPSVNAMPTNVANVEWSRSEGDFTIEL